MNCSSVWTFWVCLVLSLGTSAAVSDGWVAVLAKNPCDTGITHVRKLLNVDKSSSGYQFYNNFTASSKLQLEFNVDVNVTLVVKDVASISASRDNVFTILFFRPTPSVVVKAQALNPDERPVLRSIRIDGLEVCRNLTQADFQLSAVSFKTNKGACGRRQIFYNELIVNGAPTKPGDFPWHVALYRFELLTAKYICGGTLLTKNLVLTAAHCVIISGQQISSDLLNVVLGKYNLKGGDFSSEEREVQNITIHEDFQYRYLENDIAMLKLRTEVKFNDYIQPACLWDNRVGQKLPKGNVYGAVVGWGFDHIQDLSSQLRKAIFPILTDLECIKRKSLYYSRILNGKNFCAGLSNGTSPCNGDSGGGFVVFVPDKRDGSAANVPGAWYLRGIVSSTVSLDTAKVCDPEYSAVFTDVSKYIDWIGSKMDGS